MPKNVGRFNVDFVGTPPNLPEAGFAAPMVPNVTVNGAPIIVQTTPILPHGRGIHASPSNKMLTGSFNVFAGPNALPVCGSGDAATCGHVLISTSNVFVN